jgi:hypothetical protein
MTTLMIMHEVQDGDHWAKAWKKGPGSRHEMFAEYGANARTFRDESNPHLTGIMVDVTDMDKLMAMMATEEGKKAMAEDGLKVETIRILNKFEP